MLVSRLAAEKDIPRLWQGSRWMTVERGHRIQHREKWADSGCNLRAEPRNILMRKRRARQGWLLAFSLSNWMDRSAIDRDKNDHLRSWHREGSINRHLISSMLKMNFLVENPSRL